MKWKGEHMVYNLLHKNPLSKCTKSKNYFYPLLASVVY